MNVRYSAMRLEACASVKRLCLGLIAYLLRRKPDAVWEDVASLVPSIEVMKGNVANANWGQIRGHHTTSRCDANR